MGKRLIDLKIFKKGLDKNWDIATTPDQVTLLVRDILLVVKQFKGDSPKRTKARMLRKATERWLRKQRMYVPSAYFTRRRA